MNWLEIALYVLVGLFGSYILWLIISPSTPETPVVATTGASSGAPTVYGKDGLPKQWVFMLKMGTGGDNCTSGPTANGSKSGNFCNYLYADNESPALTLVSSYVNDKNGALHKTWAQSMGAGNGYLSWNDESPNISGGGGAGSDSPISAHSKGWIVYNASGGVYCNHSCPAWPWQPANSAMSEDAFESMGLIYKNQPKAPGTLTNLSQHFFMISMDGPTVDGMAPILQSVSPNFYVAIAAMGATAAKATPLLAAFVDNVNSGFLHNSVRDKCNYPETTSGTPEDPPAPGQYTTYHIKVGKSPITIFGKSGCHMKNVYSELALSECPSKSMTVWTFCVPHCFGAGGGDAPPGVTQYVGDAAGSKFEAHDWHANHAKIGLCDGPPGKVIVAGWNNSLSQIHRGSIFIELNEPALAASLTTLLSLPK